MLISVDNENHVVVDEINAPAHEVVNKLGIPQRDLLDNMFLLIIHLMSMCYSQMGGTWMLWEGHGRSTQRLMNWSHAKCDEIFSWEPCTLVS